MASRWYLPNRSLSSLIRFPRHLEQRVEFLLALLVVLQHEMDLRQIEEQSHKQSTELPVGIIRGFPDPAQGIHGAPEGLGVFFLCEKGFGLFPHLRALHG